LYQLNNLREIDRLLPGLVVDEPEAHSLRRINLRAISLAQATINSILPLSIRSNTQIDFHRAFCPKTLFHQDNHYLKKQAFETNVFKVKQQRFSHIVGNGFTMLTLTIR